VHDPEARRRARRDRARRACRALHLAFALTDRLDAQDQGRSALPAALSDQQAHLRLVTEIARLGLDQLLRAELEGGDIFTWCWQLDALQRSLSRDGTAALVSNSRDLEAQQLVDAHRALAVRQERYSFVPASVAQIAGETAPRQHRLAQLTALLFIADGIHSVMARHATSSGDTRQVHELLQATCSVNVDTLESQAGHIRHGISTIDRETQRAFAALGVPVPDVDSVSQS
jgi:hypothetical protein